MNITNLSKPNLTITKYKVINILTITAIPFFLLGLSIALTMALISGNYNISLNTISELGSIVYTPFPMIMNSTFILSPFLLVFFFYKLYKMVGKFVKDHKVYNILAIFGFSLFGVMNIAFFLTGIFNVDISMILHIICSLFVFIPLLIGEIIIGVVLLKKKIVHKYIPILMISAHLVVSVFYFTFNSPIFEWMIFFVLLLWGLPLSIKLIQHKQY